MNQPGIDGYFADEIRCKQKSRYSLCRQMFYGSVPGYTCCCRSGAPSPALCPPQCTRICPSTREEPAVLAIRVVSVKTMVSRQHRRFRRLTHHQGAYWRNGRRQNLQRCTRSHPQPRRSTCFRSLRPNCCRIHHLSKFIAPSHRHQSSSAGYQPTNSSAEELVTGYRLASNRPLSGHADGSETGKAAGRQGLGISTPTLSAVRLMEE